MTAIQYTHDHWPESAAITHIMFDVDTGLLGVAFPNGSVANYRTSLSAYTEFVTAESKGEHYNKFIKNHQIPVDNPITWEPGFKKENKMDDKIEEAFNVERLEFEFSDSDIQSFRAEFTKEEANAVWAALKPLGWYFEVTG